MCTLLVAFGSDDAPKRTPAHINAASATNTEIMIPELNFSFICSAGFCNLCQLRVNEFGPVFERCMYLQRIRDITANRSSD